MIISICKAFKWYGKYNNGYYGNSDVAGVDYYRALNIVLDIVDIKREAYLWRYASRLIGR